MKKIAFDVILRLALIVVLAGSAQVVESRAGQSIAGARFLRVELFFGFDRKNASPVTEDEWRTFLNDTVTPRFPDGFTVISGFGQYRGGDGKIVQEQSRLLVILIPKNDKKKSGAKIEEIRAAYKERFKQESVMRLDYVKSVEVDF